MNCVGCKYNSRPLYAEPCVDCDYNSKYEKKEDVKMSKVTIEYEEIKRPIKKVRYKSDTGNELMSYAFNDNKDIAITIDNGIFKTGVTLEKETAIELVTALNELVKQL